MVSPCRVRKPVTRHSDIRLNWRIIKTATRLIDYVVGHELVHLAIRRPHARLLVPAWDRQILLEIDPRGPFADGGSESGSNQGPVPRRSALSVGI